MDRIASAVVLELLYLQDCNLAALVHTKLYIVRNIIPESSM